MEVNYVLCGLGERAPVALLHRLLWKLYYVYLPSNSQEARMIDEKARKEIKVGKRHTESRHIMRLSHHTRHSLSSSHLVVSNRYER